MSPRSLVFRRSSPLRLEEARGRCWPAGASRALRTRRPLSTGAPRRKLGSAAVDHASVLDNPSWQVPAGTSNTRLQPPARPHPRPQGLPGGGRAGAGAQ